jgi:hypothetical protein
MPRSDIAPDHTKSKPELGRNLLRLSVELVPIKRPWRHQCRAEVPVNGIIGNLPAQVPGLRGTYRKCDFAGVRSQVFEKPVFRQLACSSALAPLSGRHFCKQPVYRPSGSSFIGQSGAISRDPSAYLTRMIHGREPADQCESQIS